jgi:hypothetical protein
LLLKLLQHWAYETGCAVIECAGRPGWAKIFSHDGHEVVWHTFELPVAECGLGESHG